jgi:UDP-sulfoquinovose synthase
VVDRAEKVGAAGREAGLDVRVEPIRNPRVELEEHYYNPDNAKFRALGLNPLKMTDALPGMLRDLVTWKDRIEARKACLLPHVNWRETAPGVGVGEPTGTRSGPPA